MNIRPLHDVIDANKLDSIVESMNSNGWIGRPILALNCGDYLQALTGSHRIAAAERAGVEVKVYTIDQTVYNGENDNEVELYTQLVDGDDDERLSAISELVSIGLVPSAAEQIMADENN